jgi:hypothetical protein
MQSEAAKVVVLESLLKKTKREQQWLAEKRMLLRSGRDRNLLFGLYPWKSIDH